MTWTSELLLLASWIPECLFILSPVYFSPFRWGSFYCSILRWHYFLCPTHSAVKPIAGVFFPLIDLFILKSPSGFLYTFCFFAETFHFLFVSCVSAGAQWSAVVRAGLKPLSDDQPLCQLCGGVSRLAFLNDFLDKPGHFEFCSMRLWILLNVFFIIHFFF